MLSRRRVLPVLVRVITRSLTAVQLRVPPLEPCPAHLVLPVAVSVHPAPQVEFPVLPVPVVLALTQA